MKQDFRLNLFLWKQCCHNTECVVNGMKFAGKIVQAVKMGE